MGGIGDWQLYGALDFGGWQARDLLLALATMHPPEVEVVLAKPRPACWWKVPINPRRRPRVSLGTRVGAAA